MDGQEDIVMVQRESDSEGGLPLHTMTFLLRMTHFLLPIVIHSFYFLPLAIHESVIYISPPPP